MDATARIASLSIALKAVSQVNNEGAESLLRSIDALLRFEIDKGQKENYETIRAARSAEPSSDDDIPF